ncbi:hypothetical protein ABZ815_34660 [Nonomuraea sp. NPDC047529]|uniref:hypothetical protein n=1 Tax=Nonomuraea sp. NPDC047529 TaxID=3155623 RepID=UPI0033FFE07D
MAGWRADAGGVRGGGARRGRGGAGATSPLVGVVAEATTLRTALACLVAFPVLAWLLARTLREPV